MRFNRVLLMFLASAMLLTFPMTASAKSAIGTAETFGVGVALGWPGNGLSFNYFMSANTSLQIDATVWMDGDWTGLGARVDVLFWQSVLASGSVCDLLWYFGPGANLFSFSWDGNHHYDYDHDAYLGFGVEFPVGIGVRFAGAPIDINVEAVPVLHIVGSHGTDADFGIAGVLDARYYF